MLDKHILKDDLAHIIFFFNQFLE